MLVKVDAPHAGKVEAPPVVKSPQRWTLVIPTPFEARPLLRESRRRGKERWLEIRGHEPVPLIICGMGAQAIRRAAQQVAHTGRGLVLAGFAGGLNPALKRGDFLLDGSPELLPELLERNSIQTDNHVDASAFSKPSADATKAVAAANKPLLPTRQVHFTASKAMILTAEDKAALYAQTEADAVELETVPLHEEATSLGLPWLSLRIVSDTADEDLPPALAKSWDPVTERMTTARFVLHHLTHPGDITRLRRFLSELDPIRQQLAFGVKRLLEKLGDIRAQPSASCQLPHR